MRSSGSTEVLARWMRMVNNVGTATKPGAKFSHVAIGTLGRGSTPVNAAAPTRSPSPCDTTTVDGSTKLSDALMRGCDCGNADACDLLAQLLDREGGDTNSARARALRDKACGLGRQQSCAPSKK